MKAMGFKKTVLAVALGLGMALGSVATANAESAQDDKSALEKSSAVLSSAVLSFLANLHADAIERGWLEPEIAAEIARLEEKFKMETATTVKNIDDLQHELDALDKDPDLKKLRDRLSDKGKKIFDDQKSNVKHGIQKKIKDAKNNVRTSRIENTSTKTSKSPLGILGPVSDVATFYVSIQSAVNSAVELRQQYESDSISTADLIFGALDITGDAANAGSAGLSVTAYGASKLFPKATTTRIMARSSPYVAIAAQSFNTAKELGKFAYMGLYEMKKEYELLVSQIYNNHANTLVAINRMVLQGKYREEIEKYINTAEEAFYSSLGTAYALMDSIESAHVDVVNAVPSALGFDIRINGAEIIELLDAIEWNGVTYTEALNFTLAPISHIDAEISNGLYKFLGLEFKKEPFKASKIVSNGIEVPIFFLGKGGIRKSLEEAVADLEKDKGYDYRDFANKKIAQREAARRYAVGRYNALERQAEAERARKENRSSSEGLVSYMPVPELDWELEALARSFGFPVFGYRQEIDGMTSMVRLSPQEIENHNAMARASQAKGNCGHGLCFFIDPITGASVKYDPELRVSKLDFTKIKLPEGLDKTEKDPKKPDPEQEKPEDDSEKLKPKKPLQYTGRVNGYVQLKDSDTLEFHEPKDLTVTSTEDGKKVQFSIKHKNLSGSYGFEVDLDQNRSVYRLNGRYVGNYLDKFTDASGETQDIQSQNSVFRFSPKGDFYSFFLNEAPTENHWKGHVVGYAGRRLAQAKVPTQDANAGVSNYHVSADSYKFFRSAFPLGLYPNMNLFINWNTGKVYGVDAGGNAEYVSELFIGSLDRNAAEIKGKYFAVNDSMNRIAVEFDMYQTVNDTTLQLYGDDFANGIGGVFDTVGVRNNMEQVSLIGHLAVKKLIDKPEPPKNNTTWQGFATGIIVKSANRRWGGTSRGVDEMAYSSSLDDVRLTLRPNNGTMMANVRVTGLDNNDVYQFGSNWQDASVYVDQNAFAVLKEFEGSPSYLAVKTGAGLDRGTGGAVVDTYDYLSWGVWGTGLVDNPSQEVHVSSRWVAGALTHKDVIGKKTGEAKYAGWVAGSIAGKQSISYENIRGSINLTANFGTEKMTGELQFTNGDVRRATFAGNISDNQFSGNLTADKIKSGKLNGAFYGPNAQEVGGNWMMKADKWQATGIFAGKKTEEK